MLRQVRQQERGDTLIEVLLAFAILSAVVVGAIVIMNQGVSSAQNSLEISLVRNQIDTQAELLRHLNNGKLTSAGRASNQVAEQWDKAISRAGSAAQPYDDIATVEQCTVTNIPPGAFFIHPINGTVIHDRFDDAATFAQVQEVDPGNMISNMLWVEAVYNNNAQTPTLTNTKYYDFHIRACWESSGVGTGLMKLGTIVRLYVPNE